MYSTYMYFKKKSVQDFSQNKTVKSLFNRLGYSLVAMQGITGAINGFLHFILFLKYRIETLWKMLELEKKIMHICTNEVL